MKKPAPKVQSSEILNLVENKLDVFFTPIFSLPIYSHTNFFILGVDRIVCVPVWTAKNFFVSRCGPPNFFLCPGVDRQNFFVSRCGPPKKFLCPGVDRQKIFCVPVWTAKNFFVSRCGPPKKNLCPGVDRRDTLNESLPPTCFLLLALPVSSISPQWFVG